MASLKDRFETFVKTLDGFEDIDTLLKSCDPDGKKRADYLLSDRTIIVEQKVLETDPVDKPQKFMDRLIAERGYLAYGRVSTKSILDKMPDGEKQHRALVQNVTKVIDVDVSNADKQAKGTREIFSITNAIGVLVILNERATLLDPEMIKYALLNAFQKTLDDGKPRYPQNNGVIVISEAHVADVPQGRHFPIMSFVSPHRPGKDAFKAFSEMLMTRWAAFNGVPLLWGDPLRYRPA